MKRTIFILICCFFAIYVSAQTMVVTKIDGTSVEFFTRDIKEVSFYASPQYVNLPKGTVDFDFPSGTLWANTVVKFNPAIHDADYDFCEWELPTKEQIEEFLYNKIEQDGIINGYVKEQGGILYGMLTSASITIPLCFSGTGLYGGNAKYDGFYVAYVDNGKLMFHKHIYSYDAFF